LNDNTDADALSALFASALDHHRRGRIAEALTLYDRIIGAAPDNAAAHCNRGIALQMLGRPEDAILAYDHAIRCRPGFADAYFNKALALTTLRRSEDALANYDLALQFKPDHLGAWMNKGGALVRLGQPDAALTCFERAIAIAPGAAGAHYEIGNALCALDRHEEAVASYDRALALNPAFVEAHSNKGNALHALKRYEEALASYDKALRINPDLALTHGNRGRTLENLGRRQEALASFDCAIAIKPDYVEAYCSRGNVLHDLNRFAEALASYDRALGLRPDFAAALCGKGICKLLQGKFAEGWPLYEWRPAPDGFVERSPHRWAAGESLEGKTVLIQAEQGLGDTIQFCRYAPLLERRGARVTIAAQDRLVRLLATLDPRVAIIPQSAPAPPHDVRVRLLSLPLALGTDANNIPADMPYLSAEPDRVARWRARLGSHGFRVGVCWQGNKESPSDFGRSFPLACFEGVAGIADVRLISLQKHDDAEQLTHLPAGMIVETLGDDFDSGRDAFLDAAAVMENLDLVISSDTAIAHLAGALGRPVWLALKHVPDWRWGLSGAHTPWYPKMRLFRQVAWDGWPEVFARMTRDLRTLAHDEAARPGVAGNLCN
jgi:tetratricopeptide (TPR) repeat protein